MKQLLPRVKKSASKRKGVRSPGALTGKSSENELKKSVHSDDERWRQDIVTLRRAAEELVRRRHGSQNVAPSRTVSSTFQQIVESLDDPSADVRKKAVRDLYELDPDQAATLVNDALRDGLPDERRRIGTALADSGLLYEAIDDLMAENHESCYGAFSLLFLVAKAGVVQPLISVIEKPPSVDLSLALIRLLASSGEPEVVSALQRLAVDTSLAPEVRVAAAETVSQMAGLITKTTSTAA
jgi:HEAT repeat protein